MRNLLDSRRTTIEVWVIWQPPVDKQDTKSLFMRRGTGSVIDAILAPDDPRSRPQRGGNTKNDFQHLEFIKPSQPPQQPATATMQRTTSVPFISSPSSSSGYSISNVATALLLVCVGVLLGRCLSGTGAKGSRTSKPRRPTPRK